MINKTLIFFLIISNLIFLNLYGDDQINFDVSEIEILDSGKKIVGKNRGTITTENGIIIQADEFEFDKVKNILQAKGNITIEDKLNNYNFIAKAITYFKNEEKIEIQGKTEAMIGNNYNFKTENISILREQMIISSDLGVKILDNKNQTRYEIGKFSYSLSDEILKGEDFFINTKYNQPFSDKLYFKSAVFNLKNQTYIMMNAML